MVDNKVKLPPLKDTYTRTMSLLKTGNVMLVLWICIMLLSTFMCMSYGEFS